MIELYNLYYIIPLELISFYFFVKATKNYNNSKSNISYFTFWLFLSLFCTYYCWGYDYNSYIARFKYVTPNSISDYLEFVYSWLIINVTHEYLEWRFVVWGLASLFVVLTFKRLNVDKNVAILLFVAIPLFQLFYVLRQSLAFAILMFGISIWSVPITRNKIINIAIALPVICVSYFFHKSMPLYIALAFVSLIFTINKKIVLVSVIAFPFLYSFVTIYCNNFIVTSVFTDQAIDAANNYLESDYQQGLTLMGWIQTILQRAPILLYLYFVLFKEGSQKLLGKEFMTFAYFSIYISLLLLNQPFSEHLSLRLWGSSLLPIVIFAALNRKIYLLNTRRYAYLYYWVAISYVWTLLYNVYYVFKIS